MDERMIFAVLGIEKTKDEDAIRAAYRAQLVKTNPEDDPEGFKRLREAYEQALQYAKRPEETGGRETDKPEDTTLSGQWLSRVREVYFSRARRFDEEEWKRLIHEDILMDLEYGEETKWKLFSFLAEHFHLTSRIYQLLDETFHIAEEEGNFKEHLPVEFVNFMLRRIQDTEGNMDFDFDEFEGADDADYDAFMGYYNELTGQTQNEDGEAASQTLRAIEQLQIDHPLLRLEKARTALLCGEKDKALEMIRPLVETRKNSLRIQVLGAEILYKCGLHAEAAQILEQYEENGYFLVEKYLTFYERERGNQALAIEHCLKALRDGDDEELEKLLEEMDLSFIEQFAPLAEDGTLQDEEASCLIGCYSRRNRAQEGIDFLEKHLAYAGRMERLHEYLCSLYFQVGRYQDSIAESRLWRENLTEEKRQEREARSYMFEGEGWFQRGREEKENAYYEKAKSCYEAAARIQPQDMNLRQKVLDMLIMLERYEEAVEMADCLIAENAGWFPAYVQKQKACFELHRAQEVIDNFYHAKNIFAGFPGIYEKAAEVFCIFGQYGDADNIFTQAKEAEVTSPMLDVLTLRCMRLKEWTEKRDRLEKGKALLSKEEQEELTRLSETLKARYEKEPADDETMGKLFQELGLLQRDRRDFKHAVRCFRKAIRYEDRPYYHYLLANALFDNNVGEEALKEYHIFEKASGPDEDLYINMARCYRFSGMREKAIEYFQKSLEVNPQNEEANGAIAALYRNMLVDSGNKYYGRLGLPYADRQLELTPQDGYYLRERGLLFLELNEFAKALEDFEASLKVEPKNPYGLNLKGKALYYLGENEKALECFGNSMHFMESNDMFTGPYLNAGDCMRREGRLEKAAEYYRRGIRDFWNSPRAVFYQRLFWMYRVNGMFQEARSILDEQWKHKQMNQADYEKDCLLIDTLIHNKNSQNYIKRAEKLAEQWDTIDAWEELSYQYLYEGDDPKKALEAALTAFRKAKNTETLWEENSVLLQIMRCCMLLGDQKQAATYATIFRFELQKKYQAEKDRDCVEQYMDDNQEDVENAFNMAQCYLAMGEMERAERCMHEMEKRRLCRKCSKNGCSEYFTLLGMILEEKGDTKQAIEQFEKALAADPSLRYPRYRLGKLIKGSKGKKKSILAAFFQK